MTAITMFDTGEYIFAIKELNDGFDFPEIDTLIEAKMKDKEAKPAEFGMDVVALDARINYLFGDLERAYNASKMPESPAPEVVEKVNNFVIGLRLDN
jgi:hypothetical protein